MKLITKLFMSFIFAISMVWEFIGKNIPEIMFTVLVAGFIGLVIIARNVESRRAYT